MVVKTTWHNIRRSPYQALVAVMITLQMFFMISIFSFYIVGSLKTIEYYESLPQVDAFFKNEATQGEIDELKKQLEATGTIKNIRFVSKEEALKIYRESNKDDPLLLELVTADILPASFHISTINIEDLQTVASILNNSTIVEKLHFNKDLVEKLAERTDILRKVGIGLTAMITINAFFVILIIIGIRIAYKKEDIKIMQLIGATNWYIRWPFILEGMFYGFFGAILGWAVAVGTLFYVRPLLSAFFIDLSVFPISYIFLLQLLGVELLLAIILGTFAGFLAVVRYLK